MSQTKHKYMVAISIPADVRADLLTRFVPRFREVYAQQVTLAYNVAANFPKPPSGVVEIFARYAGSKAEALLVRFDDRVTRLDNKNRLCLLVLSAQPGVKPGDVHDMVVAERENISYFDQSLVFRATPEVMYVHTHQPEINRLAA